MPRSEANNPTVRMGRVLDAFDELEAIYDQTVTMVSEMLTPEQFESLPNKPSLDAIIAERTRRQLTGGKVRYKREYMRRQRAIEPEAQVLRELTPEEEAAIMRELEENPEPDASAGPHKGT